MSDDHRSEPGDTLPEDLDVTGYVGPYTFPDIRRRRWPAIIYLVFGLMLMAVAGWRGVDAVLVNEGFLVAGIGLLAVAAYTWAAAWHLAVDEVAALAAAGGVVGFPVGHASAQLGWRGLRSRPTWRVLLYSAEEPPAQRGFVLVDGVDATVIAHHAETNPEDWSAYT